jgi:hypothetical protein
LQDTSRWFLRDATIKAANMLLVDHHHGLKLSRIWVHSPQIKGRNITPP